MLDVHPEQRRPHWFCWLPCEPGTLCYPKHSPALVECRSGKKQGRPPPCNPCMDRSASQVTGAVAATATGWWSTTRSRDTFGSAAFVTHLFFLHSPCSAQSAHALLVSLHVTKGGFPDDPLVLAGARASGGLGAGSFSVYPGKAKLNSTDTVRGSKRSEGEAWNAGSAAPAPAKLTHARCDEAWWPGLRTMEGTRAPCCVCCRRLASQQC